MHRIIPQNIPQSRRKEINEKILFSLSTSRPLPPETVYNCYTGEGGLHGLNRNEFGSYHDFARAKQEIENGQFLTPHELCRDLVAMLAVRKDESVLEMCCGTGNFINWLPNHRAVTAFDIDAKAIIVAKYLYPEANISREDLLRFESQQKFDIALGNPPFNMEIGDELSQMIWMTKSAELLAPGGILMALTPASFLSDAFQEKTRIEKIESSLSFIGQAMLPKNAFSGSGIDSYETKVMVFHRRSESVGFSPYQADSAMSLEELAQRLSEYRCLKDSKRMELRRESKTIDEAEQDFFDYKVSKYLYEIRTHRNLQKHLDKSIALVNRYRNQRPPENATKEQYELWNRTRLHAAGVLAVLKRYIREQDRTPRKEVSLVRTRYGFRLKAHAPRLLDKTEYKNVGFHDILTRDCGLPVSHDECKAPEKDYRAAMKVIARKENDYRRMVTPLEEHVPEKEHTSYAETATFVNQEGKTCRFTSLQRKDLAVILGRDHCLLNWQQDSGKTAAIYHRARYLSERHLIKNSVIVAPPIAIRMTWEPFLTRNGAGFVVLKKSADLESVTDGTFVVIPTTMLSRYSHEIKRFVKRKCRKLCLVFDESDELTNPSSQRTRLSLALFRRLRYKVLATGTTTRNNIAELYSQLELLYNNSSLMTCWSPKTYETDSEGDVLGISNQRYGEPFPPRGGYRLFRACHCPVKPSVFGIEKMNQDVYNSGELKEIISRTILTRKFRDFAGDRYEVTTSSVIPTEAEKAVYDTVIEEFYRICSLYFKNTGNARKEAGLRLARQIRLLIRACSTPNMMEGYSGTELPTKCARIESLIRKAPGKVAIGCTSLEAVQIYSDMISERFPERRLHVITGEVEFKKRSKMTKEFNDSESDILLCTQQSLSSSVNIPDCDDVIIESLQWNIPRMEQFYFRFIRLDSERKKRVHFVTYDESIEQNLLALVLTKERLNDFIRTGEVQSEDDINCEFGISEEMLNSFLNKDTDQEGRIHLTWGHRKVV